MSVQVGNELREILPRDDGFLQMQVELVIGRQAQKQVVTACWQDLARIKQALPGTSVGTQELATSLELHSYNQNVRFELRHIAGASFPDWGHQEVRAAPAHAILT